MRALAFLGIALLIFAPFNFVTIRQLLRIHPNWRRWILTMATIGNLMWPFFLTLRDLTPLSRVVRAVLGPLWFAWTSFAIVYTALMLMVLVCWLPFRGRPLLQNHGRIDFGEDPLFQVRLVDRRHHGPVLNADNQPDVAKQEKGIAAPFLRRLAKICDLERQAGVLIRFGSI